MQVDADIKDLTLFTKYTGKLDYLENNENDGYDSIMRYLP